MTRQGGRPLIVGNWKMNLAEPAARDLASKLVLALPFDDIDAAIAPAFPCLRAVLDVTAKTRLTVAAQNMHWESSGAFTGEVAPPMLKDLGVRYVILGHSERRQHFGETDVTVSRKVAAARRHGLTPIVCVGERESERDAGSTHDIIATQIRGAFSSDGEGAWGGTVVAYEPVWAIGTGRTPQPAEVTAAHGAIRAELDRRLGPTASSIPILYGGSVTPANATNLLRAPGVDGALVGGASLDLSSFLSIAAAAAAC